MNFYIKIKSAGKRRPILQNTPYAISCRPATLRELITAIVQKEVAAYNAKGMENMLVAFLLEDDIARQSAAGKVGFGRLYFDVKADPEEAVATAIQAFEDGLFKVVINETQATELDAAFEINESDVLTFIRLTFLAGRL